MTRQLVGVAILGVFVWFGYKVIFGGSSIATALSGPETIVSESLNLDEGQATSYTFTLPKERRIEVNVRAAPEPVNVMLMDLDQLTEYKRVRGKLFGGHFTYKQALSAQDARTFTNTDMLPEGTWAIIVERPQKSLLFTDKTSATVTIRGL